MNCPSTFRRRRTGFRGGLCASAILSVAFSLDPLPWIVSHSFGAWPGVAPDCPDTAIAVQFTQPEAWVSHCLMGESDGCTPVRYNRDLDGDGTPELFLSCREVLGSEGGVFFVFRDDGWHCFSLGSLFLDPMAFRILPPDPSRPPTMLAYVRSYAREGILQTVTYAGGRFVVTKTEPLEAGGADSVRFREIFAETLAGAQRGPDAIPEDLEQVDALESVEETYTERMGFDNAIERLGQIRTALGSFTALTEEASSCVTPEIFHKIGVTPGEIQDLGFPNWTGAVEGALRRQHRTIRRLDYELAQERRKSGAATDHDVLAARRAFAVADSAFRAFWNEFGIAD